MSERFYIHCADDINRQLIDTESDFTIHIAEICFDEDLIKLCNLLNEQQSIIDEQKIAIDEMIIDYKNLEKENEQLQKELNKQIMLLNIVGRD